MDTEIKEAFENVLVTFEAFKSANEERLRSVERRGTADPLLEQKLDKVNTALETRMSKVEAAFRRIGTSSGSGSDEDRGLTFEQRNHREAVLEYLRKGPTNVAEGTVAKIRNYERDLQVKGLSSSDDTQAGYLLAPATLEQTILKGIVELSPARAVARVTPIGTSELQIPKRTGTLTAVRTAELGTRAETTGLTYGLEKIPAPEMYAEVHVSQQLLEDSFVDIEAELAFEFAEQFAKLEGNEFVNGNAVGEMEGILTNANVGITNTGTSNSVADSDGGVNGWLDAMYAISSGYRTQGSWLMPRATIAAVRKLKTSTDKNYIWAPAISAGQPATLLGAPVVECPDFPALAAAAKIAAFGDFTRGYRMTDRVNMSILRDPYTIASTGQVKFLARRRVGGQVVNPSAIRVLRAS